MDSARCLVGICIFIVFAAKKTSYDTIRRDFLAVADRRKSYDTISLAVMQNQLSGAQSVAADKYANFNVKKLKLMHITKTGGSALERWGWDHGFEWGVRCPIVRKYSTSKQVTMRGFAAWHRPMRYFTSNPYQGYTMFTVIRDPYERMISTFRCPQAGYGTPYSGIRNRAWRANATVTELNSYLKQRLSNWLWRSKHDALFVPQTNYVFAENGDRLIAKENELRFENFDADFAAFAKRFGLPKDRVATKNKSDMRKFTISDLNEEVRRLIELAFADDFKIFGYNTLPPTGPGRHAPAVDVRKLKLVHMTKTGGSALESWGKQHGFEWGIHCPRTKQFSEDGMVTTRGLAHWHRPMRYFKSNPLEGFKLFTVIRNPYERMISTFRCPQAGYGTPYSGIRNKAWRANATATELNGYLKQRLSNWKWRVEHDALFIPQAYYVFDKNGNRLIAKEDEIRFENFAVDFTAFVNRYGLPDDKVQTRNGSDMPKFTVDDLTEDVRRLIETVFAADFKELGYEMLSPRVQSR